MLESLLERILQRTLGKYIEELDKQSLSVSVSSFSPWVLLLSIVGLERRCVAGESVTKEKRVSRVEVAHEFVAGPHRQIENKSALE